MATKVLKADMVVAADSVKNANTVGKAVTVLTVLKGKRDLPWEVYLGPVTIKVPATVDEISPLVIQLVERYPGIAGARAKAIAKQESQEAPPDKRRRGA